MCSSDLGTTPYILIGGPAARARTLGEFIAAAKAAEGKMTCASVGVSTLGYLLTKQFELLAGIKLTDVPYKGSAQAHLDIIAGNIEMMFDTTSSAMGQIKAGKFKPLAVTSAKRSAELPEVPTLIEAGLAGFDMTTWYAVYVTAGSPPEIVAKLQAELARIVALPDVQARLRGLGGEPGGMTVEQFTRYNAQEYERFGRLIREAGIKPE